MTLNEAITLAVLTIGGLFAGGWALILFYFSRSDRAEDKEEKLVMATIRSMQKSIERLDETIRDRLRDFEKKLDEKSDHFNTTLHKHEVELQQLHDKAVSVRDDMGKIATKVQRWFDEWQKSAVESIPGSGGAFRVTQRKKE